MVIDLNTCISNCRSYDLSYLYIFGLWWF